MTDSVLSRILCDTVGIFGLREQEAMHRCLDSFVRHSGMEENAAMQHMAKRWEEYCAAAPDLKWTYGSAYRFYLSGQWNRPEMWPWKDAPAGPDPCVGMYRPERVM